jgi:hypothetical protein
MVLYVNRQALANLLRLHFLRLPALCRVVFIKYLKAGELHGLRVDKTVVRADFLAGYPHPSMSITI